MRNVQVVLDKLIAIVKDISDSSSKAKKTELLTLVIKLEWCKHDASYRPPETIYVTWNHVYEFLEQYIPQENKYKKVWEEFTGRELPDIK